MIPVDEPQAHQLLGDPDCDIGDLLPNRPSFDLSINKVLLNHNIELSIGSALELVRVNKCKLPSLAQLGLANLICYRH